ncbi:MAG: exodeoxyribonuclease VII small subunit [Firmicutes bacterium]|nr:exodeoxyribonuclease VII small subunit [Bacillota bacterium]
MKKQSFEQALERLEEIAQAMENDDTGLEESVKLYKEGVELSAFCAEKLNKAHQEVTELKKTADGIFTAAPFDTENY